MALVAAPAEAGKGKPPRSPNLLLIVTDDQRAQGTMGVMARTRRAFAKDATKFPQAHVSTPLCCPSRSTILTGLYSHNHGVWFHDGTFPSEDRTLQRSLRRAGYRTGLVGKYFNGWPLDRRPADWSTFAINGGAHADAEWSVDGRRRTVAGSSTAFAGRQAKRFIRQGERRDRRPWLLYVAPTEPHGPLPGGRGRRPDGIGGFRRSPAVTESDMADKPAYLREQAPAFAATSPSPASVRLGQLQLLQRVDRMVGRVVRRLRRARELRDTLIVFTSDNGLHWGEHGGFVGKDLPYEASTHVPLLIRWPRQLAQRQPATDRRLVSNVDLAPTLLDVAGVRRTHKPDGRSLRRRGWRRSHLLLEHGGFRGHGFVIPPWIALRGEDELYVEYGPSPPYKAEREYYDLSSDPWELGNDPAAAPAELPRILRRAFRCRGPRNCP